MKDQLKIKVEEEIIKLPKIWQEAIRLSKWDNVAEEIGGQFHLTENEINDLQTEIFLILIGLEELDSFTSNIEYNLVLSKDLSLKISELTNEKIFKRVLSLASDSSETENDIPLPPYAQTYIKPVEQPRVVENRPIEPAIQPTPRQESIPTPGQTKTVEPVTQPLELNRAPNILEEKLSRPTVNTETVSNYSNPKVDPYREQF